jgi:hypothetical protein
MLRLGLSSKLYSAGMFVVAAFGTVQVCASDRDRQAVMREIQSFILTVSVECFSRRTAAVADSAKSLLQHKQPTTTTQQQ